LAPLGSDPAPSKLSNLSLAFLLHLSLFLDERRDHFIYWDADSVVAVITRVRKISDLFDVASVRINFFINAFPIFIQSLSME
jgi:hypothetical protein